MLSSGANVIIWDEMLSSGANVIIWDEMLSSGASVIIWDKTLSSGTKCYHLRMRSSLVVRASDCQCTSCNGPGFDPGIRRHSGF